MISYTYFADRKNTIPVNQGDSIKGALAIGMIFGQIIFGFFGDAIGRHRIYGKELIITMFGTLMVIVAPATMSHTGIVAWLVVFRIVTGIGIGAGLLNISSSPQIQADLLYL
jgi:PHS family inorganic phosphate transporter-like MFS transporter